MPPPHNSQYKFHVHLFDEILNVDEFDVSFAWQWYLSPLLSVSLSSRKTRCEVWWIGLQRTSFIGTPANDSPNLAALFTIPSRSSSPSSDADLLEGDALLRARERFLALQAPNRGVLHLSLLHLLIFKHILFQRFFILK